MDNKALQEVISRVSRSEAFVSDWKTNIRKWRNLYDGLHYSKKASSLEVQYSDPTHTNTVDLAVGIMLSNRIRWEASGMEPSAVEQEGASDIEKFLESVIAVNSEREEADLYYELFNHFVRDGGAGLYSIWDPLVAAGSLETKQFVDPESESGDKLSTRYVFNEIPIVTKVIDPLSMFFLPGGRKRWMVIGKKERRSVLDIEATYNVELPLYKGLTSDQKALMMGTFTDYWDYDYTDNLAAVRNCVLFNDEPLPGFELRVMKGYKDIPYTVQFFKPTSREDSGKWSSISVPLEQSVALLERAVNRRQKQIDVYSSLPIVSHTQAGRKVTVDKGLGNHIQLQMDENIGFPSWPGNPPDVQVQVDFFRSRVQQSGFSDVMYGSGGQNAGYAISQLGDQNRIRLEQPIRHLELLLSTWARKVLRLCGSFSSGAFIKATGVSRGKSFATWVDAASANYVVQAKIIPNFPNEEVRKHAEASQVRGSLSLYTIQQRYLGVEQPDDELARMQMETALQHPLMQTYGMIVALQDKAKTGDKAAIMTLQSLNQGGIPGTPGRPKESPNPMQPTGLQSSTGQPVPEALGAEPPGTSIADAMSGAANAAPGMDGLL